MLKKTAALIHIFSYWTRSPIFKPGLAHSNGNNSICILVLSAIAKVSSPDWLERPVKWELHLSALHFLHHLRQAQYPSLLQTKSDLSTSFPLLHPTINYGQGTDIFKLLEAEIPTWKPYSTFWKVRAIVSATLISSTSLLAITALVMVWRHWQNYSIHSHYLSFLLYLLAPVQSNNKPVHTVSLIFEQKVRYTGEIDSPFMFRTLNQLPKRWLTLPLWSLTIIVLHNTSCWLFFSAYPKHIPRVRSAMQLW